MFGMALPSISVSEPLSGLNGTAKSQHTPRRVFIGPMPEAVISQTEAHMLKHKTGLFHKGEASAESVSQVFKKHAFHIFLRQGGNPEDWDQDEEESVTAEMLRRWKANEWGRIWSRRRNRDEPGQVRSNWVGGSFEIGRFLGVDMMHEPDLNGDTASLSAHHRTSAKSRTTPHYAQDGRSAVQTAYETAPSEPVASTSKIDLTSKPPPIVCVDYAQNRDSEVSSTGSVCAGAAARDVQPDERTPGSSRPAPSSRSELAFPPNDKGKRKAVRYADGPVSDKGPAPPSEVLERTGTAVEATSAGASLTLSETPPSSMDAGENGVVMRDRMLLRFGYTKYEESGIHFDEVQNRTASDVRYGDWAEYMVVWRHNRIEIYEDHTIPGKEWLLGHKYLAYIIPLKSSKTHVSLYSFVDLTFCISCAPTSVRAESSQHRWVLHRAYEGTNIFILKVKSRSRAYDWMWRLWRFLRADFPETIEVHNPRLDTKVQVDVPVGDDKIFDVFDRRNVISLCKTSLRSVEDWKFLMERELLEGKKLELAWRSDTNLDWIWLDEDVNGFRRPWTVLCGLAYKHPTRPAILETRLAEHSPNHIHLKDGKRLLEPPGIEGYLERIRPNLQSKQALYLSTHDGNLFVLYPSHAHPPSPPGLAPMMGSLDFGETLRTLEAKRGGMQVMHAMGVIDLRSILLIRRAISIVPQATHIEGRTKQDEEDLLYQIWNQPEERSLFDEQDVGGDEGMAQSEDKLRLRLRRSLELLLNTGRLLRFEAYSCRVAIEWIERLRALVLYWKQRHRNDARDEMELAQARRPRLTPLTKVVPGQPPGPPADPSAPLPALGSMFNWCIVEGCKPITKGGKVYMRKGLYGPYKHVQLFLVAGHLVQFYVMPKTSLHVKKWKKTSLLDAYVCSGYLAALALPSGQYDPQNITPRRYQDGLETDDPEDDTLFMVWYRRPIVASDGSSPGTSTDIPALSDKHHILIFRTRSKLERDAWCWALNCEIEKLVRQNKERETRLREIGGLKVFS